MRFGLKFKDQSRRKATGFFVNALRHCRITEQLSFGGVEIDRYFVQQLKAVASDYTFESTLVGAKTGHLANFRQLPRARERIANPHG